MYMYPHVQCTYCITSKSGDDLAIDIGIKKYSNILRGLVDACMRNYDT